MYKAHNCSGGGITLSAPVFFPSLFGSLNEILQLVVLCMVQETVGGVVMYNVSMLFPEE